MATCCCAGYLSIPPRWTKRIKTALESTEWLCKSERITQSRVDTDALRRLVPLTPIASLALAAFPSAVVVAAAVQGDDADEVEARWRATDGTADLASPIGIDADGVVSLDLVREGPHVLIGGTTGSGKSELLRSLVAGLAASADPDHVAMVLVDYKGGAAFDCCADLPDVAGLVTDLDETLAARALRCLEAELHHRELRLRELGAEDLAVFGFNLTAAEMDTLDHYGVRPRPTLSHGRCCHSDIPFKF